MNEQQEESSSKAPAFADQLKSALRLRRMGFALLPYLAGAKKPAIKWPMSYHGYLSEEQILKYWSRHPKHQVAIIPGDDLVVFDADTDEAVQALRKIEERHGMVPSNVLETSKGEHHYYRLTNGVKARSESHSTIGFPDRIDIKTGRNPVLSLGSTNKVILKWEASKLDEVSPASQEFIDDIVRHNGGDPSHGSASGERRNSHDAITIQQLEALIGWLPADNYHDWIAVGMALFHETNGSEDGYGLFDEWSQKAANYKDCKETRQKWESFDRGVENPRALGTLKHMLRARGLDPSEILEPFEVVEMDESVELEEAVNPLDKYSVTGRSAELRAELGAQKLFLGDLMIQGRTMVIYAEPNSGKTLLVLYELINSLRKQDISGEKVYYCNMDDTSDGLIEKLEMLEEWNVNVLTDGEQGFSAKQLLPEMEGMIRSNSVRGSILILDTYTKFVDPNSKVDNREFARVTRLFCRKGGSVIVLAHTNKRKDKDVDPTYGGTSDLLNECDIMYMLNKQVSRCTNTRTVVEFECKKKRGRVKLKAAYSYLTDPASYQELFDSVERIEPLNSSAQAKTTQLEFDADVINVIKQCISEGIVKKEEIKVAASKRTALSRPKIQAVLERYTGNVWGVHQWRIEKGLSNAYNHRLLEEPSDAFASSSVSQFSGSPAPARAANSAPTALAITNKENEEFEDVKF